MDESPRMLVDLPSVLQFAPEETPITFLSTTCPVVSLLQRQFSRFNLLRLRSVVGSADANDSFPSAKASRERHATPRSSLSAGFPGGSWKARKFPIFRWSHAECRLEAPFHRITSTVRAGSPVKPGFPSRLRKLSLVQISQSGSLFERKTS